MNPRFFEVSAAGETVELEGEGLLAFFERLALRRKRERIRADWLAWHDREAGRVPVRRPLMPRGQGRAPGSRPRPEVPYTLQHADQATGYRQGEYLVEQLLTWAGCTDVQVTGGCGDGGTDLTATLADGTLIAVQVKMQRNHIVPAVVRQLRGAYAVVTGRQGVLVTSSVLTRQAMAEAERLGVWVADRDALARWMDAVNAGELWPVESLMSMNAPGRLRARLLTPG